MKSLEPVALGGCASLADSDHSEEGQGKRLSIAANHPRLWRHSLAFQEGVPGQLKLERPCLKKNPVTETCLCVFSPDLLISNESSKH